MPDEELKAPETVDLFIGQSKVVKTEAKDEGFVHYETEDGKSGLVKYDQYNAMAKEAPYDDEMVVVYKWSVVSKQILGLLLTYKLPMGEMNFVTKQVQQSIIDNYEKATAKLYKRQLTDHVRLNQIDEVLKTTTELIVE